jgi:two-component system, LytTR family, sensor kinase
MIDIFVHSRHLAVNSLGHAGGVLIFGMFLALVLSQRSRPHLRASSLSLLAAALALVWNFASLVVLLIGPSNGAGKRIIAVIGFCALSLLPSVLLDISLTNRFRGVVRAGYVLSCCAVLAHLMEFFYDSARLHRLGLAVITIGFGLLTITTVFTVLWYGDENPRLLSMRILSAMSLFLLAASFVHFSGGQSANAWSTELAVHHGGIPLALFVIMQDYRFVFLDAFVRLVVNGLLAVVVAVFIASYSPYLPYPVQVLFIGATLTVFAVTRGLLQRFLTRLVFRQPDIESAMRDLRALGAQATDETRYIDCASECVARSMNAELLNTPPAVLARIVDYRSPRLTGPAPGDRTLQERGVAVVVPISFFQGEKRYICLGARRGGRRYLSEDLAVLARFAACIAEQMEHIRAAEMQRLVSQAELRALQAQINPHFLFNAFNTLYGVIARENSGARRMLLNLSDVFRYFLQSDKAFVPLGDELKIVRAYLAIEELRLGDKLRISIDVDSDALRESVPVLSIQPLVENAVKHGVAAQPEGGTVRIHAKRGTEGLHISVQDSGTGFATTTGESRSHAGVGLDNVSRRLVLCYGSDVSLEIESDANGTTVSFVVPCERAFGRSDLGFGSHTGLVTGFPAQKHTPC